MRAGAGAYGEQQPAVALACECLASACFGDISILVLVERGAACDDACFAGGQRNRRCRRMRAGAGAYGEQQPAVALACEPLFDLLRATLTLVLQARSRLLSIAGAVHIISCILHNEHLVDIDFDHQPSSCVRHSAWQREGLAAPPVSALRKGWRGVLIFLRRVFKVRDLALRCGSMQQQPHLLCRALSDSRNSQRALTAFLTRRAAAADHSLSRVQHRSRLPHLRPPLRACALFAAARATRHRPVTAPA